MGHHHDQLLAGDLAEQIHHLDTGLGIERPGRLVGEQDVGVVHQRAGDRHPLHLSAGELIRALFDLIPEPHAHQRFGRAFAPLGFGYAGEGQGKLDVRQHGLVRDQVVVLEHEAHRMVAVGVPIGVAVEFGRNAADDEVARRVVVEPADDIQERGFPASGGTQNRDELVLAERDRDPLEGDDRTLPLSVFFSDVAQRKHDRVSFRLRPRRRIFFRIPL